MSTVSNKKALVLGGDFRIHESLVPVLRGEGFQVEEIREMRGAIAPILSDADIVILDSDSLDDKGMADCREIRSHSSAGIILLGAGLGEEDILRAYLAGCDDVVRKPFSAREVAVRARCVLRRCQPDPENPVKKKYRYGPAGKKAN